MVNFQYPEIEINKSGDRTSMQEGWNIKTCNTQEIIMSNGDSRTLKSIQSPIDIKSSHTQECHTLCNLEINYKPTKCNLVRTKQGIIKLDYDNGSYIKYNNNYYELICAKFHTPSMHTVDGNSSEMEINLYHGMAEHLFTGDVHQREKTAKDKKKEIIDNIVDKEEHPNTDENDPKFKGKFKNTQGVIISILVNHRKPEEDVEGSENNTHNNSKANNFISQFIYSDKLKELKKTNPIEDPKTTKASIEVEENWNILSLLPEKRTFYSYEGSLPFPPCTEHFQWIVFSEPIFMMEDYISTIRREGNPVGNRQVHPLNGRVVSYNNNVELKTNNLNLTEDPDKKISKEEIVKNMLAPIRITVDDRTGVEYRIKSKKIIDAYKMGDLKDYKENEESLRRINKLWEQASTIGYSMVDLSIKDNYKDIVWNYDLYPEGDYFTYYINSDSSEEKKYPSQDVLNFMSGLIYSGHFKVNTITEGEDNYDTKKGEIINKKEYKMDDFKSNFKKTLLNASIAAFVPTIGAKIATKSNNNELEAYKNYFNETETDDERRMALFFLIDWDKRLGGGKRNYFMDTIVDTEFKIEVLNLINGLGIWNVPEAPQFRKQKEQLNVTVNNKKCQQWGSHKTHYEGSLFKAFRPHITLDKKGYTYEEVMESNHKYQLIDMIKDGLLDFDGNRYMPHNNCRNPGNSKTAAWCYTDDPKMRWDYCMKPDLSYRTKEYVLLLVFVMLIFFAFYMVKLIFRYELFTQFVARLTGSKAEAVGPGK